MHTARGHVSDCATEILSKVLPDRCNPGNKRPPVSRMISVDKIHRVPRPALMACGELATTLFRWTPHAGSSPMRVQLAPFEGGCRALSFDGVRRAAPWPEVFFRRPRILFARPHQDHALATGRQGEIHQPHSVCGRD